MKKYFSLFLAFLMLISLAACGSEVEVLDGDGMTSPYSAPEEEPSEEETEASSEETTAEVVLTYESLKDMFAEHGMKVGTCLSPQMVNNATYSEIVTSQFSSVTMENLMKPDYIFNKTQSVASGDLVVEFSSDAIKLLDFAKENGLSMRGHTLIWYSQTPQWIFYEDFDESKDFVSREVMLERMESYIGQVFSKLTELGYADMFYAYDVVNEAIMESGDLRSENNPWYQIIGEDYIWYAFYYADKYAPETIDLYYNDYNEQYKTVSLINFVKTLVDEDGRSLIDGIGLQAHLYTNDSLNSYLSTVSLLASTGLKLELTELDVSLGVWQHELEGTDENLKTQGRYVYDLVKGLLDLVDAGTIQMDALTFWGFQDTLSWRSSASPLLYDSNTQPKYSYYGALQVKELAGFEE